MSYQYLLFDADDTLFDFQKAQEKSLNEVFQTIGLPAKAKTTYKTISHTLWQALEKGEITLHELKQQRFQKLIAHYATPYAGDIETLYEATLASHADLLPGAKETLAALAGHYRLFLISNGMPNIQYPRLKAAQIDSYFEKIFISEEIGAQKPSTSFFDHVFQTIDMPKEQCLVIGDSLTSDIAGGRAYGLATCYLNFQGHTVLWPLIVSKTTLNYYSY